MHYLQAHQRHAAVPRAEQSTDCGALFGGHWCVQNFFSERAFCATYAIYAAHAFCTGDFLLEKRLPSCRFSFRTENGFAGRTGTMVGVVLALQRLELGHAVDFTQIVKELRDQRQHAVQTELQYLFMIRSAPTVPPTVYAHNCSPPTV